MCEAVASNVILLALSWFADVGILVIKVFKYIVKNTTESNEN